LIFFRDKERRRVFDVLGSKERKAPASPEAQAQKEQRIEELTQSKKELEEAIKRAEEHLPWAYLNPGPLIELLRTYRASNLGYQTVEKNQDLIRKKDPLTKKEKVVK
jgi:hypothetical protein